MLKKIICMFLMIMFFVVPTFAASINVDVDNNDKIDLAYGGLNVGLSDPNDDRVLFWDDSSGSIAWLDLGEGLSLEGSILSAPLVQDTTPQLGGNLDSNNFNIYVGDGTYSWDHSPQLGIEGDVEVDGIIYADGGIQSRATTTPGITLDDSDTTEESVDAKIYANATDTGNGTEDVDIYIQGLSNGVLTNFVHFDADGSINFYRSISGSSLTLTGDIKGNVPVSLDTITNITTLAQNETKGDLRYANITLPDSWVASNAYTLGTLVRPTTENKYVYECTTAGTSDSSEPTWPTSPNSTVTDGTVTWTCRYIKTYILPTASSGNSITIYVPINYIVRIDVIDTSDTIILNGTSLTAGNAIDSAGEAGNYISLLAIDDSTWITLGHSGTWVDGGAD